ncbi:MAG: DUF1566 domain-containing protein [Dokdonella sp.]|nr:DUF1566 domain-containing protein [Dokdonella sp.]
MNLSINIRCAGDVIISARPDSQVSDLPSLISVADVPIHTTKPKPFRLADELVCDPAQRLIWTPRPIDGKRMTWAEADAACKALRLGGFSDWRLPTREELQGLVDYTRCKPAIDTALFPDTPPEAFWTSSPDAEAPGDCAWFVDFHYGNVNLRRRDYHAFVRAVRSVPASQ